MTQTDNDNEMVEVDGDQMTLAELAGIDLSTTKETRGFATPDGTYIFEIVEDGDGKAPGWRKRGEKAALVFPCKIVQVISLKNKADAPNGDPNELIGKIHYESLFLTDPVKSWEYMTAFLVDIGVGKAGKVGELAARALGKKFQANVVSSRKSGDTDVVYHNIDRNQGKIISEHKKAA